MAKFDIENISFWISPVSIMKCFIGIGWVVRGSDIELKEHRLFSDEFFSFLFKQDNKMDLKDFCKVAIEKIDEITRTKNLTSNLIKEFSTTIKKTLNNPQNQSNACRYAKKYSKWIEGWFDSYFGDVARHAVKKFNEWGIEPLQDSLGAVASFGSAIYGKYVPSLKAVCIQLDAVLKHNCPEIQFIETLLHEEVHYVIHYHMGEDSERHELTWLNELAAVLTSQYAIEKAANDILEQPRTEEVKRCLRNIRDNQKYGELADAVFEDTKDPLIAWKVWKCVFSLPEDQKRNYAKEKVIKPILHNLGWKVEFPYEYGNKYVTVFI